MKVKLPVLVEIYVAESLLTVLSREVSISNKHLLVRRCTRPLLGLVVGDRMNDHAATSAVWVDVISSQRFFGRYNGARWRFLVQKYVGGKGSSAVLRFFRNRDPIP